MHTHLLLLWVAISGSGTITRGWLPVPSRLTIALSRLLLLRRISLRRRRLLSFRSRGMRICWRGRLTRARRWILIRGSRLYNSNELQLDFDMRETIHERSQIWVGKKVTLGELRVVCARKINICYKLHPCTYMQTTCWMKDTIILGYVSF